MEYKLATTWAPYLCVHHLKQMPHLMMLDALLKKSFATLLDRPLNLSQAQCTITRLA
tara:strand:+ start:12279 stop:12449 length:171 start_codon:yes stop_codon:yes gene_type:complete